MVLLLGTSFSSKIPLSTCLSSITGIGRSYSFYVCGLLGLSQSIPIGLVPRGAIKELHRVILQNRSTGPILKQVALNNIRLKIQLKTYQGFRHLEGLPVRGQNTKTNARTSRLFKKNKQLLT
jgi:small subunit ribosomal protein S13